MPDLIDRQAAIEAIEELKTRYFDRRVILGKAQDAVNNVPSAQPEFEKRTAESAQNIPNGELISRKAAIEALTTYIHNVDKVMGTGRLSIEDCRDAAESVIEELPSVQPEPLQVARDIATIIENEQDMRVIAQPEQRWVSCEERLPDEDFQTGKGNQYSVDVLMTVFNTNDDEIIIDFGKTIDGEWYSETTGLFIPLEWKVLAWMPLPECYREEGGESDG